MTYEFPIVFHSQGVPLAGRVFRGVDSLNVRQRGVTGEVVGACLR
jgi:hypothetical protein